MIADFLDASGRRRHAAFQRWRRTHPDGFFFAFKTGRSANLHLNGGCHHLGDAKWAEGEGEGTDSLTTKRKVCEADLSALLAWARADGVVWRVCADCNRRHGSGALLPAHDSQMADPVIVNESDAGASFTEGKILTHELDRHERNPAARAACLAHHGTRCRVCDMSFEEMYGAIGVGFIEVHHRNRLADAAGSRAVNPKEDLVPVCSNCHRMIHQGGELRTPEELARLIRSGATRAGRRVTRLADAPVLPRLRPA